MENGEDIYHNLTDEQGGHIFMVNWKYIVFEVFYDGESFEGCYDTLEDAKKMIDRWT